MKGWVIFIAALLTYIVFVDIGARIAVWRNAVNAREAIFVSLYEDCIERSEKNLPDHDWTNYCRQQANDKIRGR
jgi:hypothetical protein